MKMRLSKSLHFLAKITVLAILVTISLSSIYEYAKAQTVNRPLRVIAFGDSITLGTGTTAGNNYVNLLTRYTGITIDNQSISGNTTAQGVARVDADIIAKDPDIVIVFLGGNDILQRVDEDTTFENIRTIVTKIQASGAKVVLVGIYDGIVLRDYERAYRDVAQDTDAYYVSGVLRGIIGDSDLMADAVHPNSAGHVVIANRIFPVLAEAIHDSDDSLSLHTTCYPSTTNALTDGSITWNAFAYGGNGSYSYTWSGTDNLAGTRDETRIQYKVPGVKTASVTITSGAESQTTQCSNAVTITTPPIGGSCSVRVLTPSTTNTERTVRWTVKPYGGTGNFTYAWTGTDGITNTAQSFDHTYTTFGLKTATVTLRSGDISETLTCSANLTPFITSDTAQPFGGQCELDTTRPITNRTLTWEADTTRSNGEIGYAWFGDATGTSSVSRVEYTAPGLKSAQLFISSGPNTLELHCQALIVPAATSTRGNDGSSSGCFIATAAYGSDMEDDVVALRKFRDEQLLTNPAGKIFVQTYYTVSPPIADVIAESETLKSITRTLLKPLVEAVK
jgi:acyl-CoA thioesterase-1